MENMYYHSHSAQLVLTDTGAMEGHRQGSTPGTNEKRRTQNAVLATEWVQVRTFPSPKDSRLGISVAATEREHGRRKNSFEHDSRDLP